METRTVPAQFVLMAFDNCTELDRWHDWSEFLNEIDNKVRFTFFVSGTNFLAEVKKRLYRGPHHQPGASEINFGGSVQDVSERIDFINALYNKGNEFASHAVGHFHANDENWSDADWAQEFETYNDLLDNVGRNNDLPGSAGFDFAASNVRGFRAPFLEAGASLDAALRRHQYHYDTSRTGEPDDWPVRDSNGVWRFKLASIPVAPYNRSCLSMDYNFLVLQSGGRDGPSSSWPRYREEMLNAYIAYFTRNYEGNRAPLHIGHHFAEYQGGVYKQALMQFAKSVCTLPDVKCVAYSELRDFLELLSPATLAAYQRGDFPKQSLAKAELSKPFSNAPPLIAVEALKDPEPYTLRASVVGTDRTRFESGSFEWRLLGGRTGVGATFDTAGLPRGELVSLGIIFRDAKERIRWRNTISIVVGQYNTTIIQPTGCCDLSRSCLLGGGVAKIGL